eukprot:1189231-Prorocentrum_minimum.AAC.3
MGPLTRAKSGRAGSQRGRAQHGPMMSGLVAQFYSVRVDPLQTFLVGLGEAVRWLDRFVPVHSTTMAVLSLDGQVCAAAGVAAQNRGRALLAQVQGHRDHRGRGGILEPRL